MFAKKGRNRSKKEKKHHMPDMCRAYEAYEAYEVLFRDDCIACGLCGDVLRRPRGLGGDFEFLPLKSPRNPITPIETSRVSTLHPGLYTRFREDAKPPDLPPRGRGTARRRWKEFAGGGRSKPHQIPNHMPDMRRVRRAYDFFCFRRIGVGRPNRPNGGFSARMTRPRPSADGQIVV